MRKTLTLGLIFCLISVPLLFAQEKPAAPEPTLLTCPDCHGPAFIKFQMQHTHADAIGALKCKICHGKIFASWQTGKHTRVSCEMCHGPGKGHMANPKEVKMKSCSDCHTHARH